MNRPEAELMCPDLAKVVVTFIMSDVVVVDVVVSLLSATLAIKTEHTINSKRGLTAIEVAPLSCPLLGTVVVAFAVVVVAAVVEVELPVAAAMVVVLVVVAVVSLLPAAAPEMESTTTNNAKRLAHIVTMGPKDSAGSANSVFGQASKAQMA